MSNPNRAGNITIDHVKDGLSVLVETGRAIHDAGRINSGALYAVLCGRVSLDGFNAMVRQLLNTGLVVRIGDDLAWVGPQ